MWQKVRKELFHWTVSGSRNLILWANILTGVFTLFVILRFLYYKKFGCDVKKHVSAFVRRKTGGCNLKNDFNRVFFARALCTMVILKLNPLFISIVCRFKNDHFPCAAYNIPRRWGFYPSKCKTNAAITSIFEVQRIVWQFTLISLSLHD